jgi:hypothetical protein
MWLQHSFFAHTGAVYATGMVVIGSHNHTSGDPDARIGRSAAG